MSGFSLAFEYQATDERMSDVAVLPEGWYRGAITDMETKESTNVNTGGGFVNYTVTVKDGAHAGAILFDNLMLWHTEEKVQNMTRKKLNTLCAATGQMNLTDLGQLMGPEFYFRVATQEAREQEDPNTGEVKKYPARSQIKNYRSIAEQQEADGAGAGQPEQPGKPAVSKPAFGKPPAASKPAAEPAAETQAETKTEKPASAPVGNKPPWVK